MPSQDTVSISPHTIIADVSVLFGTIIFLAQMWDGAALEHTLVTAAGSGVASYLILAVGYAGARGIIQNGVPFELDEASDSTSEESAAEPEPDEPENVPETQAA